MPSFTSSLLVLFSLTVAAHGDVMQEDGDIPKRLVRKNSQTVDADGTVRTAKLHTPERAASMVEVTASGQAHAVTASDLDAVLSEDENGSLLESKVQQVLNEFEDLARSGATPAPHKSKTIKDMVTEQLIPGLKNERDFAAGEVAASIASFAECNKKSLKGQQDMKALGDGQVATDRKTNSDCRDKEKNRHEDRKGRCGELDTFLDTVQVPQELPTGRARDAMVEYVRTMNTYFCPMEPKVSEMDTTCKAAIKEHEANKATCDRSQASFELAFCTWRTKLIDTCDQSSTCYRQAQTKYDKVKTDTQALVTKLKTEYAALKKIDCYVDVWLNDNNADTVDESQYDSCNGASVDTSAMNVDIPEPPAAAQCPLTSVKKYPGTPEFKSTEYSNYKDYSVEPIPCLGGRTSGGF